MVAHANVRTRQDAPSGAVQLNHGTQICRSLQAGSLSLNTASFATATTQAPQQQQQQQQPTNMIKAAMGTAATTTATIAPTDTTTTMTTATEPPFGVFGGTRVHVQALHKYRGPLTPDDGAAPPTSHIACTHAHHTRLMGTPQ